MTQTLLHDVRAILHAEAEAILSIPLGPPVEEAISRILKCTGKLFTTGMGKAGYVAKKAASTFCTTGTPSVFLHPGDATHGDVGVIASNDILLTYSNSGNTREVVETAFFARQLGVSSIITITSNAAAPLATQSDLVLLISPVREPCPLGLTPSASTTAMIALSDALALSTMKLRGFSKEDFAVRHHGGYLGEKSRLAADENS